MSSDPASPATADPCLAEPSAVQLKSLPGITLEVHMAGVSVTSKGQVTIPKRVRQALGITPGSKVEFDLDRGGARLQLVKKQVPSPIPYPPRRGRVRSQDRRARARMGIALGGRATGRQGPGLPCALDRPAGNHDRGP